MGAFDTIDIAATGVGVSQIWMETLAHNLSNVNTVRAGDQEPFRALYVHARGRSGGDGVDAVELLRAEGDPALVYDPGHPLADADGYVVQPVVDVAGQMADLILAQRSYQMNLRVIQSGEEAVQAALQIGRPR